MSFLPRHYLKEWMKEIGFKPYLVKAGSFILRAYGPLAAVDRQDLAAG